MTEWHDPEPALPLLVIELRFDSRIINSNVEEDEYSFGPYHQWLYMVQVEPSSDRLKIPGYRPGRVVGDPESFGLALKWIKTCDEQHTRCKRPKVANSPNWRPTRLIYVGEDKTQLRLVLGNDLEDDIKFATLSHCWGILEDRLVLTSSNIDAWKERLPQLDRWKTFVDAIDITRRLGLSYIWIDSLCIMQDSISDWQSESPLMSNVYKRSYCNIAATAASDDTLGCFWERDIYEGLPLRICFGAVADNSQDEINITPLSEYNGGLYGTYDLHEAQTWGVDITSSVLNGRGWVLQERLLTSRVLNFTKSEMYWECDELQASESHPYGFPNDPSDGVFFKTRNPYMPMDENPDIRQRQALEVWWSAVGAYTSGNNFNVRFATNLTQPSDKLVAISAVARELQPLIDSKYIAGLWERDLVRQLCWTGMNYSERSDIYRAPSWSWASVDAPIRYSDFYYPGTIWQELLEVVDVKLELQTEDPMGQVKSGFLKVRGKLLPLDVMQVTSSRYGDFKQDRGSIFLRGLRTDLHFLPDEERVPFVTPRRLFCLPIGVMFSESLSRVIQFEGIVLEKREEQGAYVRVGFLSSDLRHDSNVDDLADDPVLQAVGVFRTGPENRLSLDSQTSDSTVITII